MGGKASAGDGVTPAAVKDVAVRDRTAEKRIAKRKQALRLGHLLDDRNTGKLGDEVIKIAQAMLLCTLPYSATTETHITRTARLGDNSTLTVTFSRGIPDVLLPFGSDRKLLAWVKCNRQRHWINRKDIQNLIQKSLSFMLARLRVCTGDAMHHLKRGYNRDPNLG